MKIDEILAIIRKEISDTHELEYFSIHQSRYAATLKNIERLSLPEGAKILDVGCYPPHMFNALKKMGYDMSGISSKHEAMKGENVVSINIEKDKLPFKNELFDLILFSEVMEHLVVNPIIYLEKFRKVLKKDGTLVITTPNAAGLHKRVPLLLGKSSYFPLHELYATDSNDDTLYYRHNREYTKAELEEILDKAGFRVKTAKRIAVYGPFRDKLVQRPFLQRLVRGVAYFLTLLIEPFQDTLYIEATPKS